jgi:hypothetical protein
LKYLQNNIFCILKEKTRESIKITLKQVAFYG